MEYFIVIICFVAVTLVQSDLECSILNHPKVKPSDCCRGAELVDKTEFEKCQTLFPISDNTERVDKLILRSHVLECYLNETGILKNGEIDNGAALTQFMKIADSPLRSLIKTSIETCRNEDGKSGASGEDAVGVRERIKSAVNGIRQTVKEAVLSPNRLKVIGFFRCVEMNIYGGCPGDKKITSEECTQLTNFFEKCKLKKKV